MDEESVLRFESLRPVIKTRWDALLRTMPGNSPLTHPDLMIFMVDEILGRVTAELREKHGDGRRPGGGRPFCPCGLNPLLPYFLTGEQAIIEVAAPALGGAIETVLRHYQAVARQEIEGFCGVCVHRRRDDCPLNAGSSR